MTAEIDVAIAPEKDVTATYVATAPILFHLAHFKFRVPREDAENLVQEVFTSYLSVVDDVINPRAWLVGAVCHASRFYWRRAENRVDRADPELELSARADPASFELASKAVDVMTVRHTLSLLQKKCRDTLRLRFFDGCTAREVARELKTTEGYAEKLIHNCLKRAIVIYRRLSGIA